MVQILIIFRELPRIYLGNSVFYHKTTKNSGDFPREKTQKFIGGKFFHAEKKSIEALS